MADSVVDLEQVLERLESYPAVLPESVVENILSKAGLGSSDPQEPWRRSLSSHPSLKDFFLFPRFCYPYCIGSSVADPVPHGSELNLYPESGSCYLKISAQKPKFTMIGDVCREK